MNYNIHLNSIINIILKSLKETGEIPYKEINIRKKVTNKKMKIEEIHPQTRNKFQ